MNIILLVLSLPTENATVRQRAWRALKASGAAILRDGVYVMPALALCQRSLQAIATDVIAGGGTAYVLPAQSDTDFCHLFDRQSEYTSLLTAVLQAQQGLSLHTVMDVQKQARKWRKVWLALSAIDFFPNDAKDRSDAAIHALDRACIQIQAPNEPQAIHHQIPPCHINDYQGRVWATRQRPWADRLASAWLIQHMIDPAARFCWLADAADCPPDAIGFDFDGARFTHVNDAVTFEVLLISFGLSTPAFRRLATLIHYLDVGGSAPVEAVGIESVLAGLRSAHADDDQLLMASNAIFDGLWTHFKGNPTP
jgi:hypothetical protein